MMEMTTVLVLNAVAILGINVFAVFFLALAKWWKDFMSISIAAFFVIISGVLDLTMMAQYFPETIPFITRISVPVLAVLAASSWALVASFCYVQFILRPIRKGTKKTEKVDVKLPEM